MDTHQHAAYRQKPGFVQGALMRSVAQVFV